MGLKEEIRAKTNKVLGSVLLEELGTTVHVRRLSVGDRIFATSDTSGLPKAMGEGEDGEPIDLYGGPKIVLVGACDSAGVPIWGRDELDAVLALPQEDMMKLVNEVARLNGMVDDSGNSPQSRTDASPSDSAKS